MSRSAPLEIESGPLIPERNIHGAGRATARRFRANLICLTGEKAETSLVVGAHQRRIFQYSIKRRNVFSLLHLHENAKKLEADGSVGPLIVSPKRGSQAEWPEPADSETGSGSLIQLTGTFTPAAVRPVS